MAPAGKPGKDITMTETIVRLAADNCGQRLLTEDEMEIIRHERMMQLHPTSPVQLSRHLGVELGVLMARHAALARQQDIVAEVGRLDREELERRKAIGVMLWVLIASNALLMASATYMAVKLWL